MKTTLLVALVLVLHGCGLTIAPPHDPNPDPTPEMLVAGTSAIPNMGNFVFQEDEPTTTSWLDSLFAPSVVHAQANRLRMVGNYNGFCPRVRFDTGFGKYAVFFYGAGSLDTPDPAATEPNCTNFSSRSTDSRSHGEVAALNAKGDAPIFGDGTLSGLGVTRSPKSASVAADSGLVEVWVVRNGAVTPAGISCTLGFEHRCIDPTGVFVVLDGDGIIVTLTANPGDVHSQVQFFLGKR